ncbi:hypothetical protein TRVL_06281 [Trypanosoma vivax]|nr:hypothetical protein TRVL_06281 [Trypanosoma vivax]
MTSTQGPFPLHPSPLTVPRVSAPDLAPLKRRRACRCPHCRFHCRPHNHRRVPTALPCPLLPRSASLTISARSLSAASTARALLAHAPAHGAAVPCRPSGSFARGR